MESLMDNLLPEKWKTIDVSQKQGFKEFQIMRQHRQVSPNSFRYLIQQEDEDPRGVTIEGTQKNKDPLHDIGTCELKLDDNGRVLGVDLDGDVAVFK